jgi:epsilon-lactone hydrolase
VLTDGVPCEWIVPAERTSEPVILNIHGGGWVLGLYNNHRWKAAYLGKAAGCRVLAVDYRLAPEHPFPAALEDCVTAYRWLLNSGVSPGQIVIAGDSAGGNLTLSTALTLRDAGDPLPAALVCISPMTDLACTGETYWKNKDPMLAPRLALDLAQHYAGNTPLDTALLSPHYANLRGLPPLLIHAGEDEILLSDANRMAANARAAGVDTRLEVWPGMWHVWHIFTPFLPEAREAVEDIGNFIREHLATSHIQEISYAE